MEGIRCTADSISEEKREGTLGLLLLTDLRPIDVILGKQAGISLNSLYSLLATFPALGIPILLGGVTGGEFWRLVLALVVTLFYSLTVGTLVSVLSVQMMTAWVRASGVLVLSGVVLPLVDRALIAGGSSWGLSRFSPTGAMLGLGAELYELDPSQYWLSVGLSFVMGFGVLGLACLALPWFWNSERDRTGKGSVDKGWSPSAASRKDLDRNPVAWLAASQSGRLRRVPRAAIFLGLVLMTVAALAPVRLGVAVGLGATMLVAHLLFNLWQGLNAVSIGATLRATGFIELLFIAPLSAQEVVLGMGRGTARYCRATTITLCLTEAICVVVFGIRWFFAFPGDVGEVVFVSFLAGFVVLSLVIDLWAASWMGLYQGLVQRKRSSATALTVAWVQLLPILVYSLCFWVGPLFVIIKSVVVLLWARDRLLFEFPRLVRAHHIPESAEQKPIRAESQILPSVTGPTR